METTTSDAPKVFISYSWTSPEHELWVISLAERLVHDGVNVVLDKWDLREGQDKYAFMEQMVTDTGVSKVLAVCDKSYAEKADGRRGGVGTESQIISKGVYDKVDQQKFIPIISEYTEDGKACLPTFFSTRIYIDFSSEERLNENYEQLLRSIYNRPLYKKPALGKPPLHIFDDQKISSITSSKLQRFKDAVMKDQGHLIQGLLSDYLSSYANALEQFRITNSTEQPFDETVIKSINDTLIYRDEFINLSLFMARYVSSSTLYEEVSRFFESLIPYTEWPPDIEVWDTYLADNYRFIIYEMFLYFISALIKHERYEQTNLLIDHHYFIPATRFRAEGQLQSFTEFNYHIKTLDETRNNRLNMRRISLTSDVLKERAYHNELNFDALMQTDIILFLRSVLPEPTTHRSPWYPKTLVFAEYKGKFDLFARGASTKYFQKIKILLGINSKEDLVTKYKNAVDRGDMQRSQSLMDVSYNRLINLEHLDTL